MFLWKGCSKMYFKKMQIMMQMSVEVKLIFRWPGRLQLMPTANFASSHCSQMARVGLH